MLAPPTLEERLEVCKQHLDFSVRWKNEKLGILEMRRHYTNYFKGFENFKSFRMRLVEAHTQAEVHAILEEMLEYYSALV
jgi:tRNA-dihydrouridine synthase